MNHRIVWATATLGLAALVFGVSYLSAQRAPGPFGRGPQPGRFAVAYGSAEKIIILDSATGQLYVAREKDFKSMADLPRIGDRLAPPRGRERDDRPVEKDKAAVPDRDKRGRRFDDKDKDKRFPDKAD